MDLTAKTQTVNPKQLFLSKNCKEVGFEKFLTNLYKHLETHIHWHWKNV